VLSGEYDIDASPLFPDYEDYAKLVKESFYRVLLYYSQKSRSYGRMVWGIKHQIIRINAFRDFMHLAAKAQYIFIYRNVFDVASSDKARFPQNYPRPENFRELGELWSRNLRAMRAVKQPNVLHLEYCDILENPERIIRVLERHCGVSGIRHEVFRRKVNVSPVTDRLSEGELANNYRQPKQLEPAEYSELLSTANDACREFGYAIPSADQYNEPVDLASLAGTSTDMQ
jgi:hypothetical protein